MVPALLDFPKPLKLGRVRGVHPEGPDLPCQALVALWNDELGEGPNPSLRGPPGCLYTVELSLDSLPFSNQAIDLTQDVRVQVVGTRFAWDYIP